MLDESAVAADHASDVDVDMNSVGVHTTCALYPGTNLTTLMNSLARDTMVRYDNDTFSGGQIKSPLI